MLNNWTVKWQTKFKVNICKEMHMEKHDFNCIYGMMASKLAIASQERDLEFIVAGAIKTAVVQQWSEEKNMIRVVKKKELEWLLSRKNVNRLEKR